MWFNVEKSHGLHLGKNNKNFSYTMNGSILKSTNKEKDIGAIVSSNLKSSAQCNKVLWTGLSYHESTPNM